MNQPVLLLSLLAPGCVPPPEIADDGEGAPDQWAELWSADLPASDRAPAPPAASCPAGVAAWADATSYRTIQAALDAAVEGGTVWICPGTWRLLTWLDASGRTSLTIRGWTGAPGDVVLDAAGGIEVLLLGGGRKRVTGLTLRGASGTASVFNDPQGELELRDLIVEGNVGAVGLTPGLDLTYRELRVSRTIVRDNVGEYRGAIVLRPKVDDARAWFEEVRFERNIGDQGGAVQLDKGARPQPQRTWTLFDRCEFRDNHARGAGGAFLYASDGPDRVAFRDTRMVGNTCDSIGGTVTFEYGGASGDQRVWLVRTEVTDSYGYDAGAVTFYGSDRPPNEDKRAWVVDSRFYRNTTDTQQVTWNGALNAWEDWRLFVIDSDFGVGPDTNLPYDISGLPDDFGPGTTVTVDWDYGGIIP